MKPQRARTTAWMPEVEQCRSNCRAHEENHAIIMSYRQRHKLVIEYFQAFELQSLRVLRVLRGSD
jgi:hypothetical protein